MASTKRQRKKTLGILVLAASIFVVILGSASIAFAGYVFPDLEGHWAQNTVQYLIDKGIVDGYPDGAFKPDNNITRAEFAALAVKAFQLKPGRGKTFFDIAGHWAEEAIVTANYNGLVSGYSDNEFGPDDLLTREQVAAIVVNATKIEAGISKEMFSDSADVACWAKESVEKATAAGFITGYPDGTFRPKANATRAEATILLAKSMENSVKLAKTFNNAGTYGPESGQAVISGDVVINSDGVVLRNTTVNGKLTISEKVGGGSVTLNNVIVEGTTYLRGGGKDSIYIDGGQYTEIVLENTPNRAVRLVTKNVEGIPVTISEIAAGKEIILEGIFISLEIKADNITLSTEGRTSIEKVVIQKNIKETMLNIGKGTIVKELILASMTEVNNAVNTVLKVSGEMASESYIAFPPQMDAPPTGGGPGSPATKPVEENLDTYFDEAWRTFESTINKQALTTDPKDKVTVQYDPPNKSVNIKILEGYHSEGLIEIVLGTGINSAINELFRSEKIVKIVSEGKIIITVDENGNKKSALELQGEALELLYDWMGGNSIDTPLIDYLIGKTIDLTLFGKQEETGREFSITYRLHFY